MRFVATFATAVDVYSQLAENYEGEGSHGKEGNAAKPSLWRPNHRSAGGEASRKLIASHSCAWQDQFVCWARPVRQDAIPQEITLSLEAKENGPGTQD